MTKKELKTAMVGISDDEVRKLLYNFADYNGEYFEFICRSCGSFFISPSGDTYNCPILDKCKNCE